MKKTILLAFFILLLSSLSYAATFTTTGDGNINDGATFGNNSPGVAGTDYPNPAGGDTASIAQGHELTVPLGYTGIVTIAAAAGLSGNWTKLIILGSLTSAGAVTIGGYFELQMGAGSTFDLAGNDFIFGGGYTYTKLTIAGTAESRATITSSSGTPDFGGASAGTRCLVAVDYADFSNLDVVQLHNEGTATDNVTVEHSTFTDCGYVHFYYLNAAANLTVRYNKFTDTGPVRFRIGTGGAGVFTVQYNVFTSAATENILIYPRTGDTFSYNILSNANVAYYSAGGVFSYNIFAKSVADTSPIAPYSGETFQNNFFYSSIDNPRMFILPASGDKVTIDQNILEMSYAAGHTDPGNPILLGNIATDITRNILIDAQDGGLASAIVNKSGDYTISRNTIYINNGSASAAGLLWTEGTAVLSGTINLYDNLMVDSTNTVDSMGIYLIAAGDDQIAYTDYNFFYQVADHYSGLTFAAASECDAGYGASDSGACASNGDSADPGFVDATRTLATWDALPALGGPGTAANAITELLKLNESDYDSDYNVTDLLAYIRAGFTPTAAALNAAGKTGDDIGALDFDPPSTRNRIIIVQ